MELWAGEQQLDMVTNASYVIIVSMQHNKAAYAYLLTPSGLEEKARITMRFLRQRMQDYENIKIEIRELQIEVDKQKNIIDQAAPREINK